MRIEPCPFCASDCATSVEVDNNDGAFRVCADCGASGPWRFEREVAIERWNKVCLSSRSLYHLSAVAKKVLGHEE